MRSGGIRPSERAADQDSTKRARPNNLDRSRAYNKMQKNLRKVDPGLTQGNVALGEIGAKLLVRKGGLEPPRLCRHKNLNLRDLYRAKSSEEPTTNGRGFAPLRAPLTNGFTVRTAIEPHNSINPSDNSQLTWQIRQPSSP